MISPKLARWLSEMLEKFCFPAGTEVAVAEGHKPIEKIGEGDWVWAQSDETGEIALKRVKRIFANVAAALVVLTAGTNVLEATPEHPLWVPEQGWKAAGQVRVGDELWTRSGERIAVTGIAHKQGQFTVFNFEVEDFHSYFAGESLLLVHNTCPKFFTRRQAQERLHRSLGPSPFEDGQAHHIFDFAEHNSDLGVKLQLWGIDLNSTQNGVWLPKYAGEDLFAAIHRGRSSGSYKDYVANLLSQASNGAEALDILRTVKQDLLSGLQRINNAK